MCSSSHCKSCAHLLHFLLLRMFNPQLALILLQTQCGLGQDIYLRQLWTLTLVMILKKQVHVKVTRTQNLTRQPIMELMMPTLSKHSIALGILAKYQADIMSLLACRVIWWCKTKTRRAPLVWMQTTDIPEDIQGGNIILRLTPRKHHRQQHHHH